MTSYEVITTDKIPARKIQVTERQPTFSNLGSNKMKSITRSPLRYPGGKTRAIDSIFSLIPENTKEMGSPFFGGGSVEITCANNGIKVYGYDVFSPLVEFWQCLLSDPIRLSETIKKYYPLPKVKFYKLQQTQRNHKSKYERAAIFYVLNRSSFSGSTLSGGMSPGHPRFNESSIERIRNFKIENMHIKELDFKESIHKHPKALLYLDPPYLTKNTLYGKNGDAHKNFDHIGLAKILKNREKWILSYNDSPEIHELYKGYSFHYPNWKYGMSNNKTSKEVLILSKDIAKYNELNGK